MSESKIAWNVVLNVFASLVAVNLDVWREGLCLVITWALTSIHVDVYYFQFQLQVVDVDVRLAKWRCVARTMSALHLYSYKWLDGKK